MTSPTSVRSPQRRSPLARPVVAIPLVLVVAGVLGWGYVAWSDASAAAATRARVLTDVDAALAKQPPDGSELSACVAALRKLPDHETANDLLAAQARIELARGRPERAQQLFAGVATGPGASPAEQGLGARILLLVHESGVVDGPRAAGMLQQIVQMADTAYRDSGDPADLLRVWQAAERAGDRARSKQAAEELTAKHAASPQAKFVQFARAFDGKGGVNAVNVIAVDLVPEPVEAGAMRAFAALGENDTKHAVAVIDDTLRRAPGVGVVRWTAAAVYQMCVMGSEAGSADRASWIARRDAQLDWLMAQSTTDDVTRAKVTEMRKLQ